MLQEAAKHYQTSFPSSFCYLPQRLGRVAALPVCPASRYPYLTRLNLFFYIRMSSNVSTVQTEVGLGAKIPPSPELFPLIISNFDTKFSHGALPKICLVCRFWKKIAQPLIFSHLSLCLVSQCVAWNEKFDAYPHLALAVTDLMIWGSEREPRDPDADADAHDSYDDYDYVRPNLLEDEAAHKLFARLTNVTHLDISCFYYWNSPMMDVMHQLISVRTLTLLDMPFDSQDIIDLLYHMPSLDSLSLGPLARPCPEEDRPETRVAGRVLKQISLPAQKSSSLSTVLEWLLSPTFDLHGVQDVTFLWNCISTRYPRVNWPRSSLD